MQNASIIKRYWSLVGDQQKRVLKKYHIVLGKITKIGKHGDNYKIIFKNPETKAKTNEWFSVEDLADLRKRPKKGKIEKVNEKYKELLKPISRQDRHESFQEQGFQVNLDSLGDRNCQFNSISQKFD